MKLTYLLPTLLLSLSATITVCNGGDYRGAPAVQETAMTSTDTNANRDVNNSGINSRDRDTNNLTADNQSNSPNDRDITKKIRKALVSDTTYSMTAKNVKIITVNGRVTLRGPVNSNAEKSGIETLAKNAAGEGNVDNQLEVKSQP